MASSRRTRGDGSMYQRKDGIWIGVLDFGWVNGKRVRKTVSASTLRELRPKFRELQVNAGIGVANGASTVASWMDYWLTEIAPRKVRGRTLEGYLSYNRTWITPHLGRHRLDKLKPEHVRAMTKAMAEAGRSTTTQRQAHLILQSALSAAVKDRKIAYNPAQVTDKPAAAKKHHGVLDRDDALAVLALLAAYGEDGQWCVASRFLAALLAGLRQGEALGLRWEDVELTPGAEAMFIRQTVQRQTGKGLVVTPTKSDKPRLVPMIAPLAHAMRMHAQAGTDGYVWGRGEKPAEPRPDYEDWVGLLWSAGVARKPLHAARATTASILGEARVPMRTIADILGHSQITTSWTSYLHTDDRQMREGLDQGWAMLQGGPSRTPTGE